MFLREVPVQGGWTPVDCRRLHYCTTRSFRTCGVETAGSYHVNDEGIASSADQPVLGAPARPVQFTELGIKSERYIQESDYES